MKQLTVIIAATFLSMVAYSQKVVEYKATDTTHFWYKIPPEKADTFRCLIMVCDTTSMTQFGSWDDWAHGGFMMYRFGYGIQRFNKPYEFLTEDKKALPPKYVVWDFRRLRN